MVVTELKTQGGGRPQLTIKFVIQFQTQFFNSSNCKHLGIVVGLFDFHFLLSILRVLLILSMLFRATIGVFVVPCCPVLLSFYLLLSYMFERNKWRWRWRSKQPSQFLPPSHIKLRLWGGIITLHHRCKKRFYVFLFWSRFLLFILSTFSILKKRWQNRRVSKRKNGNEIPSVECSTPVFAVPLNSVLP